MNRFQWAVLCTGGGLTLAFAASFVVTEMTCEGNHCREQMGEFLADLAVAIVVGGLGSTMFVVGVILFIFEAVEARKRT